jgi:hypothetical protein
VLATPAGLLDTPVRVPETHTDKAGNWRLVLAPGTYAITASDQGSCLAGRAQLSIRTPEPPHLLTVRVTPQPVFRAQLSPALAGAALVVTAQTSSGFATTVRHVVADASGALSVCGEDVASGDALVHAENGDVQRISLGSRAGRPRSPQEKGGGTLAGIVVTADGHPPPLHPYVSLPRTDCLRRWPLPTSPSAKPTQADGSW